MLGSFLLKSGGHHKMKDMKIRGVLPQIGACIFAIILLVCSIGTSAADIITSARRVTWQGNVGVPGGIPNRTTVCSRTPLTPLGGGADDQPQIQAAINNCPNNTVVSLNAGMFVLKSPLVIRRSSITIRGVGTTQTVLDFKGESEYAVIYFMGPGAAYEPPSTRYKTWTAGLTRGSSVITLSSTGDLAAGDLLVLDQINDNSTLVFVPGSEGGYPDTPDNNTRHLMQVVRVQSISGANVTIDPPVYMDHNISLTPKAYWWKGSVENAGIENLKIKNSNGSAQYNVAFEYSYACWVKNIESAVADVAHVFTFRVKSLEIRDSYFHETINYASSSYGINLSMASACLVENNAFSTITTPMMVSSGASGNVFGYNYATNMRYDVNSRWLTPVLSSHSAHTSMNLWEGNIAPNAYMDFIHGSSSHNTLFRNSIAGWESGKSANTYPVVIEAKNRYINIVGNVLGTAGYHNRYEAVNVSYGGSSAIYVLGYYGTNHTDLTNYDAEVYNTLLRHGNWDVVTNAVVWDASIADRSIPPSLYLTSKPSWWGASLPWPAIGPDVSPMAGPIPAWRRFLALPAPPTNLHVVSQ
jgi:hypothetical protein